MGNGVQRAPLVGGRNRGSLESSDAKLATLLNAPTMVFLVCTMLFPIGYSLVTSLYDLNYKRPHRRPFVGLQNYIDLLSDTDFLVTLGRTGIFVFFSVASVLCFGTLIALLLNQRFKGRAILRTVILIPWAIPPVVNGIMWKYLLDSSYGVLNGILYKLGVIESYIPFLATNTSAFAWVVFADVWKNLPFAILLLLAALQTIPKELYESARVDGASRLAAIFHHHRSDDLRYSRGRADLSDDDRPESVRSYLRHDLRGAGGRDHGYRLAALRGIVQVPELRTRQRYRLHYHPADLRAGVAVLPAVQAGLLRRP